MVNYDIINMTDEKIDNLNTIKKIIDYTLKTENIKNSIFNIIIVNNNKIKQLNNEYRNINKETDVISFALEDYKDNIKFNIRVLGDIYISIDKVKEQALEYNHSILRELCFLSVHGLLHLIGYDHQTLATENIMKEKTEVILNEFKINR